MSFTRSDLFKVLAQVIFLIFGLILLLWFLYRIQEVLLIFSASVVLALVLNTPISWLESRSIRRLPGTLLTLFAALVVIFIVGSFVMPQLSKELANLVANLPDYASHLSDQVSRILRGYPSLEGQLRLDIASLTQYVPEIPNFLGRIGRYSLSVLGFLGLAGITLLMAIYMVIYPQPLLHAYLRVFPPQKVGPASRAFIRGSRMVEAWIWSNILIGGIKAIVVGVFFTWISIPGAFLWSILALFAELVPVLGPYLMAIPPILVALSISPEKTWWVILFYILLNEATNYFISPPIRASTMKIHPVTTLFAVLAFGSAFGLLGAVLATPLTGILLSFYNELYLADREENEESEGLVERMLRFKSSTNRLPEGNDEKLVLTSSELAPGDRKKS